VSQHNRDKIDSLTYWYAPELRRFSDQDAAVEACLQATGPTRSWVVSVASSVISSIVIVILILWLNRYGISRKSAVLVAVVVGVLTVMAVIFVLGIIRRTKFRQRVRQILWNQGTRICPKCGYDMRGTPSDTCSECGHHACVREIKNSRPVG
jgi:VIT1/CCC1 family predicted Fe2+/Mn2+ transporter